MRLKPSDAYELERYTWAVRNGREDALFQENRDDFLHWKANPQKLAEMSEAEIEAMETKFGPVKMTELLDDWKKMAEAKEKGGKAQPQVKADVVNDIARMYEVNRREDPEHYHALSENVQALNNDLRVKLGREPSTQELLAAAKKAYAEDLLVVEERWYGNRRKRALTMTSSEKLAADELKRKKEAGK